MVAGPQLRPVLLVLLVAALLSLALQGCTYRASTPVEGLGVDLEYDEPPIDAAIELCLPPKLRKSHWRFGDRFYVVWLGNPTAKEVERQTKQVVRDVIVSHAETCGVATDRPWLSVEFSEIYRQKNSPGFGLTTTRVALDWQLRGDTGELLWRHRASATRESREPLTEAEHRYAARDFGHVMNEVLAGGFQELATSGDVRRALDLISLSGEGQSREVESGEEGLPLPTDG